MLSLRVCVMFLIGLLSVMGLTSVTNIDLLSSNYPGHSGSIICSTQKNLHDSYVLVSDPSHFLSSSLPSSLCFSTLHAVFTRVMGYVSSAQGNNDELAASMDDTQNAQLAQPKAHVMISVSDVGSELLESVPLFHDVSSGLLGAAVRLNNPSLSSINSATTISTGVNANVHGVVDWKWQSNGKAQHAYDTKSSDSFSHAATLADVVVQNTAGKSLVLSVSGCEKMAWAFGVNPALSRSRSYTNAYTIALVDSATKFGAVSDNTAPGLDYDIGHLTADLQGTDSFLLELAHSSVQARVDGEAHTVTVSFAGGVSQVHEQAVFNLKSKDDAALFAELQYYYTLPKKIQSIKALHDLTQDEVSDFLALNVVSLGKSLKAHGHGSAQFRAGLFVFHALLPHMLQQYTNLFNSPILQSVVYLGSHRSVVDVQDPREIVSVLSQFGLDATYFPNLYVNADLPAVCQKLTRDLAAFDYTAYCPSVVNTPRVFAESHRFQSLSVKVGNYTYPTQAEIERYQIVLWFGIAIFFITVGAVYQLAYMSFKKDTMLYSSFNPNWEDRKRR